MSYKRGDKVVVMGDPKYDGDVGKIGTVWWIGEGTVDIIVDGRNVVYSKTRISGLPESVRELEDVGNPYPWALDIEFGDGSHMELAYDVEPELSWGNDMVKIRYTDGVHLFPIADIAHVHLCRR